MTPRQIRRYGEDIVEVLRSSDDIEESNLPDLVIRDDMPISHSKLKRLKEVVDQRASELSVAPELLMKRRYLEKLMRSGDGKGGYELPKELMGWRAKVIAEDLIEVLAE